MSVAGAGRLVLLPYWTRPTRPFAPPGGVRGAGAGLGAATLRESLSSTVPRLPSHRQAKCTELELDGWCCYPTG